MDCPAGEPAYLMLGDASDPEEPGAVALDPIGFDPVASDGEEGVDGGAGLDEASISSLLFSYQNRCACNINSRSCVCVLVRVDR